jgi:hypothetical protein
MECSLERLLISFRSVISDRFIWRCSFRGEDFFRNRPIRNTICMWRLCLTTDRNEMSTLSRGPSIDFSYLVSVHLAMRFQSRIFFLNWTIRKNNCPWRPCLLSDREEFSNLYRGHSTDAICQVRFIWRSGFRGEHFLEIHQSETRIVHGGHVC